jgi:hypothetical protein
MEPSPGNSIGTLDLYLTPQFSDKVKALAELALDVSPDQLVESLDAERFQLGYAFSDQLTLWAGRFHTPMGYWLTSYHHGAEIQPSIYKPRLIDWEDHTGSLPAHSVGFWLTGKMNAGSGKVLYDLMVANGSRIIQGRINLNLYGDDNHSPALGGRLSYQFGDALEGLLVGVNGLTEEVNSYDNTNQLLKRTQLNILGAYLVYEENGFEFSSEFYAFLNQDISNSLGVAHNSWSGFAHLGYSVLPDLIPYVRVERSKLDQSDNYWNSLINGYSFDRILFGIRYNINSKTCIKLEANQTTVKDSINVPTYMGFNNTTGFTLNPTTYNEIRGQYAIAF